MPVGKGESREHLKGGVVGKKTPGNTENEVRCRENRGVGRWF